MKFLEKVLETRQIQNLEKSNILNERTTGTINWNNKSFRDAGLTRSI